MRELKFRAWEKSLKQMIAVDDIDFKNGMINTGTAWRMFDEVELMQFINYEDKNGKEVYEGDIVNCVYDGELNRYVVVFDLSELDFKATNGKEKYGKNFQYLLCCEEVEVMGNIYEDKEKAQA
jgi:uncharacterized phage protein (TIGR01671 family)